MRIMTYSFSVIAAATLVHATSSTNFAAPPVLTDSDVFVSGVGGYHTYRIPAIAQTKTPGILLLFCEVSYSCKTHPLRPTFYTAIDHRYHHRVES